MLHPERRKENRKKLISFEDHGKGDFSVTWAEVREMMNQTLDDSEPVAMYKIIEAANRAWDKIFDDKCQKYGITFKDGDGDG